jgi:hypothetical protein
MLSVPYHLAVPPSYSNDDASASLFGSVSSCMALVSGSGFASTAIALLRPASARENASSFSLLYDAEREFEVV